MSKAFNTWYFQLCCKRAKKFKYRVEVIKWIETHLCEDKTNEVIWFDLHKAIKKDKGIKVGSALLRGLMYEQGYSTVSEYAIDTYVFTVKYKLDNTDVK